MTINIAHPLQEIIFKYHTGQPFYLRSVDESFAESPALFARIADVCNEPIIYHFVFERRLESVPYPVERAAHFIRWGKEGWATQSWFSFLIVDQQGQIVGTIDIRGNDADGSEIGYWVSAASSGVMTNAVLKLTQIGQRAGFRQFFALVFPENQKSVAVLERAGFVNKGDHIKDNMTLRRYELVFDTV